MTVKKSITKVASRGWMETMRSPGERLTTKAERAMHFEHVATPVTTPFDLEYWMRNRETDSSILPVTHARCPSRSWHYAPIWNKTLLNSMLI